MDGVYLIFYVNEQDKHEGILLYEWILEEAHRAGIKGGTAFKGIAGFGKHGEMHEEHFFELGSNVPIRVEFIMSEQEAKQLLDTLEKKRAEFFYAKHSVECGRKNRS